MPLKSIGRALIDEITTQKAPVICLNIAGLAFGELLLFSSTQHQRKRADDPRRNSILDREDVSEFLIECAIPQRPAVLHAKESNSDAQALPDR